MPQFDVMSGLGHLHCYSGYGAVAIRPTMICSDRLCNICEDYTEGLMLLDDILPQPLLTVDKCRFNNLFVIKAYNRIYRQLRRLKYAFKAFGKFTYNKANITFENVSYN